MGESPKALADLRILDLAGEAGSMCGKLLAGMGADVIKVEPPGGDATRGHGPFLEDVPGPGRSLYFWHYNLNKRSITLDLERVEGRRIFRRLAGGADVIIETFEPGFLDVLGLGYGALRARNEKLIMVSISPFGLTGPRHKWKGSDLVALAMGGMLNVCGDPDMPPVRPYGNQACEVASAYAATAVLVAAHYRALTGRGQHIDVSLQESVDSVLEVVNNFYNYRRAINGRQGTRHGLRGPGRAGDVFPCKDGYICFVGPEPHQLRSLFEWMAGEGKGADLLTDDTYLVGMLGGNRPPEVEEHIYEVVREFTLTHTATELFTEGQRRGVTLAPVTPVDQLTSNPQLQARGFFVQVEHPDMKEAFTYCGANAICSVTPWSARHRPPLAGEHNQEILWGELGISPAELEALARRKVI